VNTVYLSLGANQGDSVAQLEKAISLIRGLGRLTAISKFYKTRPWGNLNQPDFINLALELLTDKSPEKLLYELQQIEQSIGRVKEEKWGPRIIDIDIVFFNNQKINLPDLQIPHPQAHLRTFVLVPMNEIAPNFEHPSFGKTISELMKQFSINQDVIPL
jgi:2-amino-4-hydroxy-6-hydroxymethyldihydropteridine diphosphokinase